MTYAPRELLEARAYLLSELDMHPGRTVGSDLDPAEAGIVGDSAHRGGYHCGSDRTVSGDYSVTESSRDRKGLTQAAAALDIGHFDVKGRTLRHMSLWLVEQCKAGAPDTQDIREIIYTPDGRVVKRWDRLGKRSTGDSSHLWHTHISYFRDSESRDKTGLFRRYIEGDDGMSFDTVWTGGYINKIDKASGTSPRMTPASFQAWNHEYNKQQLQKLEILIGLVSKGTGADVGKIIDEALKKSATLERQERAEERADLIATMTALAPEMAETIAKSLPDNTDVKALASALGAELAKRLAA